MIEYDKFVFDEIRRIGKAWMDTNPGDHDIEQLFEKIGDMSWRRLKDEKSVRNILIEIGVNPEDYGEPSNPVPVPVPGPIDPIGLKIKPRYGMSVSAMITDSRFNISETIKRFVDAGVQTTRVNLLAALWKEEAYRPDTLPYTQLSDGKWDLYKWNLRYFERLQEVKEGMNSNGINIQWCSFGLYDWSKRKAGSQQENTPVRHNINGVFWSPEDITLEILPDAWFKDWLKKICPLLDLEFNPFELGNEMPEKGLHERMRDEVRKIVPNALIQVNRNEDTPGQYANMKIGKNYDFISFHGRRLKQVDDLDIVYKDEPTYKTFNEFINNCPHDKSRVIFSSDGARISTDPVNTYDWDNLGHFANKMKFFGYGYEHQSRAKMTPAPNHHMIEVDWFKKYLSD